jgi:Domain of unknown function (DUF4258)
MLNYSTHARTRMQERKITEDDITTALRRQSRPPQPGDNGNIVRFGHCGSRILKIVLSADEQTIVSVMPVGEG